MHRSITRALGLCASIVLLTACGGGGGGDDPGDGPGVESTGYFIDSAVEGMRYVTSSGISGVTDASGAFLYGTGDTVTFYIGDIEVGQAAGTAVLTPVSLVPGAVDETNATVTNIARFLQSLDSDGNADNGITISAAVATAATGQSIDFSSAAFDAEGAALVESLRTTAYGDGGTLVDAATASAHLQGSLLCERAGDFSGTWTQTAGPGSDSGTWSFTVDGAGNISGTGRSAENPELGTFGVSGTLSSDGTSTVGAVTVGATFSGTIDLDGSASGTWSSDGFGTSGTYRGSRISSPSTCSSSS